jgi:hypothetical protein
LIGEHYHQIDFSVRYAHRDELLIAADAPVDEDADVRGTIDTLASSVRFIPHVELVAARMWSDSCNRMRAAISSADSGRTDSREFATPSAG